MQSPLREIISPEIIDRLLDRLATQKWAYLDLTATEPAVTPPLQNLLNFAENSWQAGQFKEAATGRGSEQEVRRQIRNDSILWLDWNSPDLLPWQNLLQQLQMELNQGLMLGIQAFEAHLARYAEGQYYDEHIDQPRAQSFLHGERIISFVLYLNQDWKEDHGGQLQIRDHEGALHLIEPRWGRLALFDSKEILHQVLLSKRVRWSLTGWFRRT